MSLAAKISSAELTKQVTDSYVNNYLEVALVYSPGTTYVPGTTNDTTFLNSELTPGVGGYKRQVIGYSSSDVSIYADKGIGLARKAAVFEHDGSGTAMTFSHICLLRSSGNIITFNTPTSTPTAAVDGTYLDLPTTTSGSGSEALIKLVVGSAGTTFTITPSFPGYNYTIGDTITVAEADLVSAGVCTVGAGNLVATVATVTNGGDAIYSVSKPNVDVSVTDSRQVVVYFDIKHFGFYN